MLDVSRIDIPPPFTALQLLNVVDPVMESVEDEEREAEIAPPLLEELLQANEQPVIERIDEVKSTAETAPPSLDA